MKLIINNRNLSQLCSKMIWSGDEFNVVRKLQFDVAWSKVDYYLKILNVEIKEGDTVFFKTDEDKILFRGVIIDISHSESGSSLSFTAFDYMFYVNNSDINLVSDSTAENITAQICSQLGIKHGSLAQTNIQQYQAFLSVKAYKAIIKAYSFASNKTGKKYMPIMDDDKLTVIEKGQDSGVVLDEDYNLTDASYKVSLSKLVNKVLVLSADGVILDTIIDENLKRYGIVQKTVTEDRDKAKAMLHGAERTINVSAIGDIRAISGRSLMYIDPDTKKKVKFYISSDSHTFTDSSEVMNLELVLENVMDEG